MDHKEKAAELLTCISRGDMNHALDFISPNSYIQHNVNVGDGVKGLAEMLTDLGTTLPSLNIVRIFQDGDYVVSHAEGNYFGPKVGFDIFRFEDGRIAEHWDNLQNRTDGSPGGHTMTDGDTKIKDHGRTEINKTLVRRMIEDIVIRGNINNLGTYWSEDCIEHNPEMEDGIAGMMRGLKMMEQRHGMRYDRIHMVLGEGNFVLSVCEGSYEDNPASFYDLFRVEGNKVVEHWDTTEIIPPRSKWKNYNGKF